MAACNKGVLRHPATHPLTFLVGNATKRKVFDIIHAHVFGPSQDVQLFIVVISTAGTGKSYLINMIWQLFTDHAAASALKVTVPTGMQVAAANIHHGPRSGYVADIQSIQRDSK